PRIALIGDAAFVARPHVGAGVTKAALDADALAAALAAHADDLGAALARYERAHLHFGRGLVDMSRQEGAYIAASGKPPRQRRGGREAAARGAGRGAAARHPQPGRGPSREPRPFARARGGTRLARDSFIASFFVASYSAPAFPSPRAYLRAAGRGTQAPSKRR